MYVTFACVSGDASTTPLGDIHEFVVLLLRRGALMQLDTKVEHLAIDAVKDCDGPALGLVPAEWQVVNRRGSMQHGWVRAHTLQVFSMVLNGARGWALYLGAFGAFGAVSKST
jgi:hypothetical protein